MNIGPQEAPGGPKGPQEAPGGPTAAAAAAECARPPQPEAEFKNLYQNGTSKVVRPPP